MIYIPTQREIQEKVKNLVEKFEINSQHEKSKLIQDLIIRLLTIFKFKNVDINILYNSILIVIQMAHSPLQTNLDIEMMRERFEERYIHLESDKIVKNIKHFEYTYDSRKYFEPVNYDSISEEDSESSDHS
jgi:hypothetical protein